MTTPRSDDEVAGAERPKWLERDGVAEWFAGKDAADLDIIEREGRQAIAETIHRRNLATGKIESTQVRIWVADQYDKARGRIDALTWVKKLARLKERPTWSEACDLLGEAYVDQLDTVCLLARCVRDHDAPEHQHMMYEDFDRFYGRNSLMDLWERLSHYDFQTDPRHHELDEDTFWGVVKSIDRVRNPSPLAAINGAARDTFVTSMAVRLWSSRAGSSS